MKNEMKETAKDIAAAIVAGTVILAMIAVSMAGIYGIGVIAVIMTY
ncbi:MAG: hypothetical protein LUE11_04920 [Clostridia bacterium]|nr:hypothetical protein [Clostridia bacterium]